ncbi:hypothetical protein QQF64_011024 [Cirrhinus molitorella]|uniref:Myelin and lymphocyte protein n=1 Tax=Cirrhinus molitorella TaxID=172907 RepID=A0ABR3LY17_9TELE
MTRPGDLLLWVEGNVLTELYRIGNQIRRETNRHCLELCNTTSVPMSNQVCVCVSSSDTRSASHSDKVSMMPSGCKIFTTMPDILFIPEFVFGGLVWTLVASTKVDPANPQGWVMFVSLFCFLITTVWFFIFVTGINQSSIWPSLDVGYHAIGASFYLSAAVLLANVTIKNQETFRNYRTDIAAVVMAFIATLLYWIHAILSAFRWKSS